MVRGVLERGTFGYGVCVRERERECEREIPLARVCVRESGT